eukprot:3324449-Rhodomonas_salina.1
MESGGEEAGRDVVRGEQAAADPRTMCTSNNATSAEPGSARTSDTPECNEAVGTKTVRMAQAKPTVHMRQQALVCRCETDSRVDKVGRKADGDDGRLVQSTSELPQPPSPSAQHA